MNIHVFMLEMFHDEWLLTWISAHPFWGRSRLRRPVCRCLRKPWEPESEGSHYTPHGSLKNFRSTYAVPKIICHLHCPKKYLNITIKGQACYDWSGCNCIMYMYGFCLHAVHCLKSYFFQLAVSKCSIIYHRHVCDRSLRKCRLN